MKQFNIKIRMDNIYDMLLNISVFIFFNHGFLYFFRPNEIYDSNSRLKLIKYFLFIIISILCLKKMKIKKIAMLLLTFGIMTILNYISMGGTFNNNYLILYMIPMLTILNFDGLKSSVNFEKIIKITYIFSSIVAYVEFFFLDGVFNRFAVLGYRVISIFVNPNNFGIILPILTFIMYINNFNKHIILFNTLILIKLTGSRTGMLLTSLIVAYVFFCDIKKIFKLKKITKNEIYRLYLTVILLFVFIFIILFQQNLILNIVDSLFNSTRDTGQLYIKNDMRLMGLKDTLNNGDLIFPWINGEIPIDNAYINVYGMFSFFGLLFFLIFNIYIIYICFKKNLKEIFTLIFMILISGITTNYLYLWPIGYVYWYLISIVLLERNNWRENE